MDYSKLDDKADPYCMHLNPAEEVILSPPGEVSVCPGEDSEPLIFMCTTNRSFIEWNVTLVLESGERITRTRLVTPAGHTSICTTSR